MKKEKDLFVAVLIDGDNASSEKMEDVMRFVSRYGTAVVRRIYGDWTKKKLSGWKDAARDYSFRMVQASSFVQGKNTTDIALVMDAMDILHEGRVGCFCLVASDGDYTLLAQRIRESGLMVLGYGEGKTPVALVRSCTGEHISIWTHSGLIRYRYKPCETDSLPCRQQLLRQGKHRYFFSIRIKPEPDSGLNPH